jgi:hypothetical protein
MNPSIPASEVVNVVPGVVSAGGNGLDLSGLFLTSSTRIPLGAVLKFSGSNLPGDVATYFGTGSPEALRAATYVASFDGSDIKPGALLFTQYNTAPVAGYVRGGAGLTLAQVQAITTGTLTITADGTSKTSSALNLSAATSFSNAASLILAAFTSPGFTITWDSIAQAFVVTSATTDASSTIAVTTGSVATTLLLTAATGAVTSPGAVAATPATFMNTVLTQTQDFASFAAITELSNNDALALAGWNSAQGNRFAFINWDTDANNTVNGSTSTFAYLLSQTTYSGTSVVYAPVNGADAAAFMMGYGASLDFSLANGRADICDRTQTGLAADVTSQAAYDVLMAAKVNCIAAFGTANAQFIFFRRGFVSGPFLWLDSYFNQIWLNNALQLAGMNLLSQVKNIPYTARGDAIINEGLGGPIADAVNFGAIQPGVALSTSQITQINNSAGKNIASLIQNRGWYLQIVAATAPDRAARNPRQVKLWYADGQSVQGLNINSLEVQ